MKRLDTTTPPLQARREVAQKITPSANFVVPALQASVIAVAVGIIAAVVVIWLGINGWLALIAALLVFVVTFSWRMDTVELAQKSIEEIWSAPSQQPQLPMPEKPPQDRVVLLEPHKGREALASDNRDRYAQGWHAFIDCCGRGQTSMTLWESRIGRAQYTDWRDKLFAAGHAEWIDGKKSKGWELTAAAETIKAAWRVPPTPHGAHVRPE